MRRLWSCSDRCCLSMPQRSWCGVICVPAKSGDQMSANKKIVVENLRLSYGSNEVLHGISFDVYENEILGIIGPAQSGKTSLLRCINRTIEFNANARVSGTLKVDGIDVQDQDVFELRQNIGMVAPL